MSPSPSLLIVGVPRSGTTWTGRVLGRTEGAVYVNEPDGFRDPFAFRVMLARGENPIVGVGESASDYERLWRGALAGGDPTGTLRDREGLPFLIPDGLLVRAATLVADFVGS